MAAILPEKPEETTKVIALTPDQISKIPYREGPLDAEIAFVGEAPGRDEELDPLLRPFVGVSGQLLRELCHKTGTEPKNIYFTNVIKERPPGNKFDRWKKEHPAEYSTYVRLLSAELAALKNLKMVVPVGGEALEALCGKKSIESWRGSISRCTLAGVKDIKSIAIIHPAALLRKWSYRSYTVLDLQRIAEERKTPDIVLPQRTYLIRPKYEEVMNYLDEMEASLLPISTDVETLHGRIVSVQMCVTPWRAMCIPFQYRNGESYWPIEQEVMIWKRIATILETHSIIGQNFLTFDTFMFDCHGVRWRKVLENVHLDTMEAASCLQPELPKGLDFLTSVYTREPFYKSEGKEWETKSGENEFWTYGCKDVCVVAEIAPQQEKELHEEGLWDFYRERFWKNAFQRMKMSKRGIKRDEVKRKELEIEYGKKIVREQCELILLAGENVNVGSHKQMCELLYEKMKLPKQWKDDRLTADEDAILTLASRHPSPMFEHILTLRHLRVLYSTNIKAKVDSDGRFRTSYGFAETGRYRSFKNPLGTGGNLQNWNRDMRIMLVPDEGYCFVAGDLSQAELRIVIWRTRDERLIQILNSGADYHRLAASRVFKIPPDQITKTQRYSGKRIVHASDYDMHAEKFAKVYNKDAADNGVPLISVSDSANMLAAYHEFAPGIRGVYQKEISEEVARTKILVNHFGRRMIFHERIGPDMYRSAYSWYAQADVADLTNTIMAKAEPMLERIDAHLMHQNHDELLTMCRPKDVKEVVKIIHAESQIPLMIEGRELIIPMDFKVGMNWKEMEDIKL